MADELQVATLNAEKRRIPVWVKCVYTAFVAILVPNYWMDYGPTNFLYYCDVALLMTLVAIWLESPLLVSMPAVGILLPQTIWMLDFFGECVGWRLTGLTGYMFDTNIPFFTRFLSFFHFWLPLLLLWLVWRIGYDRRALPSWTALAWLLMFVCFFFMPMPPAPPELPNLPVNINYVYGFSSKTPQQSMPPLAYFGLLLVVMPAAIYLPTHLALSKVFRSSRSIVPMLLFAACLLGSASGGYAAEPPAGDDKLPPAATAMVDFDRDVRPLLTEHCVRCHGPKQQKGGLRLDRKADALQGGENYSPAIMPGKSASSPLIRMVAGLEAGMEMPAEGDRLSAKQVGLLRAWIDQGAKWPDDAVVADDPRRTHWAWQPVRRALPPQVARRDWSRGAVDQFILAKLEESRLTPTAEADRATLVRRLYFSLLGLPPTPEQVAEFVADPRPDAYDALVDRLLDSPHFGERWARHWLDVVRFAESDGFETNQPRPNAWPYRDYVIRAFNTDKPYDRFVFEQLAGDSVGVDEATGFLVGGPVDRVKSPDIVLTLTQRSDELHDMIGTTGTALLGITVGCARCHNHKFDPVSQTDYYALRAVFSGVQHGERPLKPIDHDQRVAEAERLRAEIARIDQRLAQFEPFSWPRETLLLDDSPESTPPAQRGVTQVVPRGGLEPHRPGAERGQASDAGDAGRLPDLGRNYSHWNHVAGRDLMTWNPHLTGRYRVWISWGCGYTTHTPDARYLIDRDGDLATRDDQRAIARIDQRRFADQISTTDQASSAMPVVPSQPLWSGFWDAGVHELSDSARLVLRAGDDDAYVTADLVCFQAEPSPVALSDATSRAPHLRSGVTRRANVERFTPVDARWVRMTILETNQSEPCLDEFEVYSADKEPRNVALAAHGAKVSASSTLPGYAIHQLKHLNDGKYGNNWSWIANARQGWVMIELPATTRIDRVVWSRDREEPGQFEDRTATRYRIEVAVEPDQWTTVASSDDRVPLTMGKVVIPTLAATSPVEAQQLAKLAADRKRWAEILQQSSQLPVAYSGRLTEPEPTFRLHRGDPMMKREPVSPGGIAAFGSAWQLAENAADGDRRVALANWVIDPTHPLTARVMVNRLWHYHFGQGIVATPSDFGVNGARPTHPELLDWLATELIRSGWSLKHLHRLIVQSATYRQSATANDKALATDAQTRLLWRFPPRRLEAEVIRDAILTASGQIDYRMGGPGFDLFEPNTNYVKVYQAKQNFAAADFRRMVYQSKPRMQLDDVFGAFDCPDAGQVAPKRNSSNTPLQALNLLNSPFILQQSELLAERLQREAGADPDRQLRLAFALLFGREPASDEQAAGRQLIAEHGLAIFCRTLFNASEFLYVY